MKRITYEGFYDPPKKYTMVPFWFWNDGLDENSLAEQLSAMHEKGVFECIIHARKGLEVEYLSDDWFKRIRSVAGRARSLGMKLWIYDEDNWPSGYAGGRVVDKEPSFAAHCLSVEKIYPVLGEDITVKDIPGKPVEAVIAVHRNETFVDITDYSVTPRRCKSWHSETLQWEVFVFRTEECSHKPAYGKVPYVDLLNPKATQAFIACTHAEYKRRLPEYWGSTVCGFFTDEPGFYQNYFEQARNLNTIIWTANFRERFKDRFGYDIVPQLFALWEEAGGLSARVRRDYYAAVSAFYCESYFRPIHDFLAADGLKLIGHLHKEEGLFDLVQTEGGFFDCMNELDYTGIDLIDRMFPRITEKLGSSAMRVLKKERCMDECFGAFGWDLSPQEIKARTDLMFVQGINMLVPHAFFSSIEGIRAKECPPSLFFQNGYWKYFRSYADYVRRMSYFCSRGEAETGVAVIWPELTARARFRPLFRCEARDLDRCMLALGELLSSALCDFDFVPEGTSLKRYGMVILPRVRYLSAEGARALKSFASGGGKVVIIGDSVPEGIGEERETVAAALAKIPCSYVGEERSVLPFIRESPVCVHTEGEHEGVRVMRRRSENCSFYYFVNTVSKPCSFVFEANGEAAEIWDAESGACLPAEYTRGGGKLYVHCDLCGYGSVVFAVRKSALPSSAPRKPARVRKLHRRWRAEGCGASGDTVQLTFHGADVHGKSGEVCFTARIRVLSCTDAVLRLEDVRDCYVSVSVNGMNRGARLWAPYEFDLGNVQGETELRITVGNMLENEVEGTDKDAGVFGGAFLDLY